MVGVNEYYTSKKCPRCHRFLYQINIRRLACAHCCSRVHRDIIGAHNIANAARQQLTNFTRPDYLQPTDEHGNCLWTKGIKTSTPDPIKRLTPEQEHYLGIGQQFFSWKRIEISPAQPTPHREARDALNRQRTVQQQQTRQQERQRMQVQSAGDVVQQVNSNFDPIKTPTMTKHVSDDIPAHARSKKRGDSPGKVVTTQATTHDSAIPGSPPATSNLKGPPRKKSRGDLSKTAAKTDMTHDSATPGSPPATSNQKGSSRKRSREDLSQTAAKTDTTHGSATPGSPPATSNLKGTSRKRSREDLSQTAAKTDTTDKNTESKTRSEIPTKTLPNTSATGYWSYSSRSDGRGSTSSYSGSQGASSGNAVTLHTLTAERAEVEGEAGASKRDQDSVKQDASIIRGDNRSTDTSRPSPTLEVQPPKSPAASSHRQ